MLQTPLVLEQSRTEPDWVCVKSTVPVLIEFLRSGIQPTAYRQYDVKRHIWLVHWSRLPLLVQVAQRIYARVDWSTLPDRWQVFIVSGQPPPIVILKPRDSFAVLFLTTEAPEVVVKAAYKALSMIYHPDHGGDQDKMSELNAAYDKIQSLRK